MLIGSSVLHLGFQQISSAFVPAALQTGPLVHASRFFHVRGLAARTALQRGIPGPAARTALQRGVSVTGSAYPASLLICSHVTSARMSPMVPSVA